MKRFNNKILIIILAVLAGAFVLTRVFRSPARESNLDSDALAVDTAAIDRILLYPAIENHTEVKLTKDVDGWTVSHDNTTGRANEDRIETLLSRLAALKPERIVTRKEEKWDEYDVSDSAGTEISVFAGSDEVAHFRVGKESMGVTFVRKSADEEVYAVTGSAGSAFNVKFDDWRDPYLLRLTKDDITRIEFTYPADSGFVLVRKAQTWMVDDSPADSARTDNYLNKLKVKKLTQFDNEFSASSPSDVTMKIDAGVPLVVKGWRVSPEKWILESDLQPGAYFSDENGVVAKDIFPAKKTLLK